MVANRIDIFAPRWNDRKLLIAKWKVKPGTNEIHVMARKKDGTRYFPNPIVATDTQLAKYPVKKHPHGEMVEADLNELLEEEDALLHRL